MVNHSPGPNRAERCGADEQGCLLGRGSESHPISMPESHQRRPSNVRDARRVWQLGITDAYALSPVTPRSARGRRAARGR